MVLKYFPTTHLPNVLALAGMSVVANFIAAHLPNGNYLVDSAVTIVNHE
jgi:hypothetical protein